LNAPITDEISTAGTTISVVGPSSIQGGILALSFATNNNVYAYRCTSRPCDSAAKWPLDTVKIGREIIGHALEDRDLILHRMDHAAETDVRPDDRRVRVPLQKSFHLVQIRLVAALPGDEPDVAGVAQPGPVAVRG